jgi:hypothetical protein
MLTGILLAGKAGLVKTNLPENIMVLLAEDYKKIADQYFKNNAKH